MGMSDCDTSQQSTPTSAMHDDLQVPGFPQDLQQPPNYVPTTCDPITWSPSFLTSSNSLYEY